MGYSLFYENIMVYINYKMLSASEWKQVQAFTSS